jgi:hypothetical protein
MSDVFDAAAEGNLAKVKAFIESGIIVDSKNSGAYSSSLGL